MKQENNDSKICPICGKPIHKKSKYCIFHASVEEKTEKEFIEALKVYVDKIKEEDGYHDFNKFVFIGDINFKKDLSIDIFKKADFGAATFKEDALLEEAIFEGDANFVGVTFKGRANFDGVTFKEDALFKVTTFEGDANFVAVTFKGRAFFDGVTFKEDALFKVTTFEGDANFVAVTFKGRAFFDSVTIEKDANFVGVTFEGDANFVGVTFKGSASFWEATFEGDTDFREATFEIGAFFNGVTIEGDALFKEATFKGSADFREVTFKGDNDFRIKSLAGNIYFQNIKVLLGKKLILKVENNKTVVSFERAYLENIYLDIELVEGVFIDFTGALLRNTKIKKDQIENHILQEKEKKFSEAKEIYLLLKNNYHSIGQYEDESWTFTKEKEMERKSLSFPYYKKTLKTDDKNEKFTILKWIKKGDFIKWIILGFSNIIYGYGEKPWNVIRTAIIIILLFGLSFSLIGIANPEIIELNGTAIQQNSGNIIDLTFKGLLENNVIRNFPDSLYFSTITFTTLGYGDFRPLEGWGRILAGSEAFIGAFMMALFVYTFARRTGGR